jgi:hypothetical protein
VPTFRTGRVTRLIASRAGIQHVEVDGEKAYVLSDVIGPVELDDRVVVNTTAVDLGLGTGGWHVVHWNLARDGWHRPGRGHLMKLRYTSEQIDTGVWSDPAAGGDEPPALPDLGGLAVVVATLHSHLAPLAAAIAMAAGDRERRVAWVMDDTAALPLPLSDLAAALVDAGLLHTTVSCGQAFGGQHEAASVPHGLELAAREADIAVVVPGPGLAGSGSAVGFGAVAAAWHLDAASRMGGHTALAVRAGHSDQRPRHRVVSHHTRTVLSLATRPVTLPLPAGTAGDEAAAALEPLGPHRIERVTVPDVSGLLAAHGITVTSMGRVLSEDPVAVACAAAPGVWASTLGPT